MENDIDCPICFNSYSRENYILKDSNKNHGINSRCRHWFCVNCIYKFKNNYIHKCPLCREDLTELLECYDDDEETDEIQKS